MSFQKRTYCHPTENPYIRPRISMGKIPTVEKARPMIMRRRNLKKKKTLRVEN